MSAQQPSSVKLPACLSCAKRKVRCNKEEPCSNCKRRKTDHCTYPGLSPQERVKKYAALVRSLGGDPDDIYESGHEQHEIQLDSAQSHAGPAPGHNQLVSSKAAPKNHDPVLTKEDEHSVYLEWYVYSIRTTNNTKIGTALFSHLGLGEIVDKIVVYRHSVQRICRSCLFKWQQSLMH